VLNFLKSVRIGLDKMLIELAVVQTARNNCFGRLLELKAEYSANRLSMKQKGSRCSLYWKIENLSYLKPKWFESFVCLLDSVKKIDHFDFVQVEHKIWKSISNFGYY